MPQSLNSEILVQSTREMMQNVDNNTVVNFRKFRTSEQIYAYFRFSVNSHLLVLCIQPALCCTFALQKSCLHSVNQLTSFYFIHLYRSIFMLRASVMWYYMPTGRFSQLNRFGKFLFNFFLSKTDFKLVFSFKWQNCFTTVLEKQTWRLHCSSYVLEMAWVCWLTGIFPTGWSSISFVPT